MGHLRSSLRRRAGSSSASGCLALLLAFAAGLAAAPAAAGGDEVLSWPDEHLRFWREGPAWLLPEAERERLAALPEAERGEAMAAFLAADPVPETPVNELAEGVERRRRLMLEESLGSWDERARLLFLHGRPEERRPIDCAEAFQPLELWRYGEQRLLLYRPGPRRSWRLWVPFDSKRALYTKELEFWLEEWSAYKDHLRGRKRIDRVICPEAREIDEVTGVDGLDEVRPEQPDNRALLAFLAPPEDLAAWAVAAATTKLPPAAPELPVADVSLRFPRLDGLLMVTRLLLTLPAGAPLAPFAEEGKEPEVRLVAAGVVEDDEELLEAFRVRWTQPPPGGEPLHVAFERTLRPGGRYLLRLRLTDEIGGAERVLRVAFEVPREPQGEDLAEPLGPLAELDRQLARRPDALALLLPPDEVVFGSLRVQALVRGERIARVTFLLDGEPQLTRTAPPWSVELPLPLLPREMAVRAEGYDADGQLVASDEALLNQQRGELAVEITEPARGAQPAGPFAAELQVVVPEGRRVEQVELSINERPVAQLTAPPWRAELPAPPDEELVYLTAVVRLDDGAVAEDVRFLRTTEFMGEVDVDLVEVYATVLDRRGEPVLGLDASAFTVFEDGRRQQIARFELVDDLPLTVGVTLDVSGSMYASLGEAQRAAADFLERVIGPDDQCFAVAFADRPALLVPRTSDPGAVAAALGNLKADGWTSLHDAVVFSLYSLQGVSGRRALVLLSDGDDTDSRVEFPQTLEYARHSNAAIYAIGLQNDALDGKARRKLEQLARATGGRAFFIARAEELVDVYERIEAELRSQYLLAYDSDAEGGDGAFRSVEVEVAGAGLTVRTVPGYTP